MVAISFGKVRLGRVGGGRPGLPAALWAAPSRDRAAPCESRPGSGHAFGFLSLGNRRRFWRFWPKPPRQALLRALHIRPSTSRTASLDRAMLIFKFCVSCDALFVP